jgi:hypothetical protein
MSNNTIIQASTNIQPYAADNQPHPIAYLIDEYANTLLNIAETAKIVLPHAAQWLIDELKSNSKRVNTCLSSAIDQRKDGNVEYIAFANAHDFAAYNSAMRESQRILGNNAPDVLTKSMFMHLFSEFDAFTGKLLKAIYLKNENLLKGITREISLADLLVYKDIESVMRALLEKEIETFRRDSYAEQFCTLEKKFGITLRKFNEWGDFVELSQRRNLFTHNGGVVSEQYLITCGKEGTKFTGQPNIGDTLDIDFNYFIQAVRLITRVGMMLGYTLWNKVVPNEREVFHDSLNGSLYTCLTHERWQLVAEMGGFALSEHMRKDASDITLRIRVINIAIALKFSNQQGECLKLLQKFDWTASYRDFKLAIAVLDDNLTGAIEIMKIIGRSGEMIDQTAYHTWPLFTKLREQGEFYKAYQDIYNEPYFKKPQTIQADEPKKIEVPVNSEDDKELSEVVKKTRRRKPKNNPIAE